MAASDHDRNLSLAGSLEDPAFKSAVRRVWGQERAPDYLRQRVIEALSNTEYAPGSAPIRLPAAATNRVANPAAARAYKPLYGMAAAAVLLLGLGSAGYVLWQNSPTNGPNAAFAALPRPLAVALVSRHDSCCSRPDHHGLQDVGDDFPKISQVLQQKLGHPVLAKSVEESRPWDFRGAAVCPVESIPAAHLVFVQGREAISMFSMPASAMPACRAGSTCEAAIEGHPIAGFIRDGAFYCLVGSSPDGSLTVARVKTLRDRVQNNGPAALAEAGFVPSRPLFAHSGH